jgi:hypothetical protein
VEGQSFCNSRCQHSAISTQPFGYQPLMANR